MTRRPAPDEARAGTSKGTTKNEFEKLINRLESWTPDQPAPDAHTIRWLRTVELPDTPFLYESRVPYGIWTHWTKAGGYKSAMAAQFEHALVYGHAIPGLSWTPARTGSVLVIDPDGTTEESQDRTFRIAPFGQLPSDGTDFRQVGAEIVTIHEPRGATVEERIAWLWQQVERWEAAIGPIVWIRWDTLASLLGSSEKNAYDHAAGVLRALNHRMAAERRVLFLPHHAGKSGEMIGSTAIYGCSNLVTKVVRTKGADTGTIEVDGKCRGTAPWSLSVAFTAGTVRLVDYHPVQARHQPGSVARRVADVLADAGATEQAGLYEALPGVPTNQVRKAVSRMEETGQLVREDGALSLVPPVDVDQEPEGWPAGSIGEAMSAEEPARIVIPSQRSEPDPEVVPELVAGNPAIEKMIEMLPPNQGMYPVRRLKPEIKPQIGYDKVCVGGTPNRHEVFPAEAPDGLVSVFDRKAAFFQSAAKVWLVPNHLHREGELDYHRVLHDNLAGMFQIIVPAWKSSRPHPLGPLVKPGARVLVPRPTLDRLMDTVRAGLSEEPYILWGLVGKGTETLLRPWAQWCMQVRRDAAAAGATQDEIDLIKDHQSKAIGCLRKLDPNEPGPVDRADWQHALRGHHYAQMNRYVYKALDMGDEVVGSGNTDEIIFRVPDGVRDPERWVPASMVDHVAKGRFALKYVTTGEQWFAKPLGERRG